MNSHAVKDFITLFQAAQNGYGVLHVGLVDHNGLKAPFQRRVLFNIFAVLVKRGRAYAVQLSARQKGLQEVARVHCPVAFACADNGVQLVDKQNNSALALLDFVEHCLQTLLELSAKLRAGNQRTHVKREDGLVLEPFGNVASDYAQCQTFRNGGFAYARLAYEHGIVFGFAGKYSYYVSDFSVPPDNGVQLVGARAFHKVEAVLVERVVGCFGVVAGYSVRFHFFKLL